MRCFAAWALWFLGQPDQASDQMEQALSVARELSEPHGLAHALFFAAILHQLRREERMAQKCAEDAIGVSCEHGLMMYRAHSTITRGWALIEQGLPENAIEQMRDGLAAREATGTELMRPHLLAQLADALGKVHQPDEGLRILEEALAVADRTSEQCYRAELYRLRGELLLMQSTRRAVSHSAMGGKAVAQAEPPAVTIAESCFKQSINIARRQNAKSLELRAVMSLARLYQTQGRQNEARDPLAQIYDGFTEGFATTDLREAKALLDAL